MRIVKAAALALVGLFATATVQAAPVATKPVTEPVVTLVQAKKEAPKKAAPKKAAPKKAAPKKKKASSRFCGKTLMYYDKKAKKCVSAADKK